MPSGSNTKPNSKIISNTIPDTNKCYNCDSTINPIKYYESSKKTWCDECQEIWQDHEIYHDNLDEILENQKLDRKMNIKYGSDDK